VEGQRERPHSGVSRSRGGPDGAGFCPGSYQVGPNLVMEVFTVFLTCYLMVVGPSIHVLAPYWSKVCFLGSMRCHGHMGTCVAANCHVA
jgi:hypothetical protein